MRVRTQPTGRALVICFAAVAITFTLATAVAQISSIEIRAASHGITANASPSIAELTAMRGTMRKLQVLTVAYVADCQARNCGPIPQQIDVLRRDLVQEWEAYTRLPTFRDEPQQWSTVEEELQQLEEGLARVYDAAAHGVQGEPSALLDVSVTGSFDRLDDAIAALVDFNGQHGSDLAKQMDALAHRSLLLSVVLDLLSIAFTVVAATLAIRYVRRYERLLRTHAEELDQFAGRVAHDVLSPLATTTAALHVARRGADEAGREALDRARKSVDLVQQLVRGLLEFARAAASPDPHARADVRGVAAAIVDQLRPIAESARVELTVDASLEGAAACSRGVLSSVLSNLVGNGVRHMGDGTVRQVLVRGGAAGRDGHVRIEVADTGPGIPADIAARVFEPFVRGTARGPGFGLGLATVRRIVLAHHGAIGFEPGAERGTTFWVELPRAREVAELRRRERTG